MPLLLHKVADFLPRGHVDSDDDNDDEDDDHEDEDMDEDGNMLCVGVQWWGAGGGVGSDTCRRC